MRRSHDCRWCADPVAPSRLWWDRSPAGGALGWWSRRSGTPCRYADARRSREPETPPVHFPARCCHLPMRRQAGGLRVPPRRPAAATGVEHEPGLLLEPLERRITDLARDGRFEEAAEVRDRYRALGRTLERRRLDGPAAGRVDHRRRTRWVGRPHRAWPARRRMGTGRSVAAPCPRRCHGAHRDDPAGWRGCRRSRSRLEVAGLTRRAATRHRRFSQPSVPPRRDARAHRRVTPRCASRGGCP